MLEGIAALALHPIKTVEGLIALVTDKEVRTQVGEAISAEWDAKINRITVAKAEGGDQNAVQLGRDAGNLFYQAVTTIVAAGGIAKLASSLGKAGIHVGKKTLEEFLHVDLAKAGRTLGPNGKPLLDSSLLVTKEATARAPIPSQTITTTISSTRLNMQLAAEQAAGVRMPTEITGYTRHGMNQAISRDGGIGTNSKSILDAWKNPILIEYFPTNRGPTFRLTGKDATISVNSKGELVTVWSTSKIGARK